LKASTETILSIDDYNQPEVSGAFLNKWRSCMAWIINKIVFPCSTLLFLWLFFLWPLSSATLAFAAAGTTLSSSQDPELEESSPAMPVKPVNARIQSSGQKIVEEDALRNQAGGSTPPVPPTGGTNMKKMKKVTVIKSSEKSEGRQMSGPSAIQNDDSLSSSDETKGKNAKGKAATKEDSF
jgi:hypothetical protein